MSTLKKLGYLLAFGLICFVAGVVVQWARASDAQHMADACNKNLMDMQAWGDREEGVLDLQRARAELGRANFGNVNELLARAKSRFLSNASVVAAIDKAQKSALAQDATAPSTIDDAMRVAEDAVGSPAGPATPAPATPVK